MENTSPTYEMSDATIGHVAQLLQVAILTGTDIIDHFRAAKFTVDDNGSLVLHPEYAKNFDENIQKMLATAAENIAQEVSEAQPTAAKSVTFDDQRDSAIFKLGDTIER